MKKKLPIILIVMLFITSINPVMANGLSPFQLEINNAAYELKNIPFVWEDSIFLPLREISEKIGYEIGWDENNRAVDLIRNNERLKLYLDSNRIVLNGGELTLYHLPVVKENSVYVGIDLFSNYLENIVALNNDYTKISIDEKKPSTEEIFTESQDEALKNKLKHFMKLYTENQNFQGSVLIAKGNEILLNDGYGYSNEALGIRNNNQTKFAIGSITKQFVGAGIVQLEERGLLNFDDKVSQYVAGLEYGDEITIHHLLTHTSGLVNATDLIEFYELTESTPMEIVNLVKDMDLIFNPGERFAYNNTNYVLLGMILEKVSGETMENYFYQHFFEPAGMKDTGVSYGKRPGFNIATPYQGYVETYEVDDKPLLANAYGAGNVYSTVEDVYRWNEALEGETILSKAAKEKLFRGHAEMGSIQYAYGWMVGEDQNGQFYQHDGSTLGFSALSRKYVDQDTTIVILANRRLQKVYEIAAALEVILNGGNVEDSQIAKLPEAIEMDVKEYEKYTGRYNGLNPLSMSNMVMNLFTEEDQLFLQVDEQEPIQIFPKGNHQFFIKVMDAHMVFELNEEDIANKIVFTQMGIDFKGYKEGYEKEEVVIEEEVLEKYVGIYELEEGFDLKITLENGTLYLTPTGQGTMELSPISETKFELMVVDASMDFIAEKNGAVNSLHYKQGAYEKVAHRK